jgi:glycosyltransferase involved in cell wall biosynthesis
MNNRYNTISSSKPLLSLIIAVYKKPEFLKLVLQSCLRQKFTNFEIVIADDGSGDDIRKVIESFDGKFKYPVVHCWHDDNGFRKTIIVNRAVMTAKADYIVFIDGDCILHRKFLESHWRNKKEGVILSGRRVRLDEKITGNITCEDISSGRMENPFFWFRNCRTKDIKHGLYIPLFSSLENLVKIKMWRILGSNFSIHRSDYLSINGYDERIIGRGMEDSNLNERALLKCLKIRSIVREAVQYHLFHTFDPIPHSSEVIREYCNPTNYWTPHGIVKS